MRRHVLALLTDLYLIATATILAGAIRDNLDISAQRLAQLMPYVGWTLLVAAVVLSVMGLSRSIWRFTSMADYMRLIPAVIAIVTGAVGMGFLFNRLENVARALPLLQGILMIFLLVGARVGFRLYHQARRRSRPRLLATATARSVETVLVVGINRLTELYMHSIQEQAPDRIKVVGLLGRTERHTGWLVQNTPVLGVPEDVTAIVNDLIVRGMFVDRIVVTTIFEQLPLEAQEALLDLERNSNVQLDFFAQRLLFDKLGSQATGQRSESSVRDAVAGDKTGGDAVSFVIDQDTLDALARQPYWIVKRGLDFVLAATMIIVLSPVFLIVAAIVAVDVSWPVTFWQQRPGLGGHNFKLFKFRTMAAAYDSAGKRIPDDARLSSIGKFLRGSRLDELPQLVHVLLGEMSFVGPRPLLPVDQSAAHAARLLVRPGITGWAQVKGGRAISASDKAALDVWYVKHASFRLDCAILAATVPLVVWGETIDPAAIRAAWQDLIANGICTSVSAPSDTLVKSSPGRRI